MPMGHHRAVWSTTTVASIGYYMSADDFANAPVPGQITLPKEFIYLTGVNCHDAAGAEVLVTLQERDILTGLFKTFDQMLVKDESLYLPVGGTPPMRIEQAEMQVIVSPIPNPGDSFHVTAYVIPLRFVAPEFT